MISLDVDDDALGAMEGATVASQFDAGVAYRLERVLGVGGMGVAFFAMRVAPDGESSVVMKLVKPSVVRASGQAATLLVSKEAVALGRLNERVPATPFVVRLIDTGTVDTLVGGQPVTLPWLAVEYVHGGPEGTTLEERVKFSVRYSQAAFDPERAVAAVEALGAGLAAIHEVGVIHRDLTPGNVLCCGAGEDEIFKIADFGIARPSGMAGDLRRRGARHAGLRPARAVRRGSGVDRRGERRVQLRVRDLLPADRGALLPREHAGGGRGDGKCVRRGGG